MHKINKVLHAWKKRKCWGKNKEREIKTECKNMKFMSSKYRSSTLKSYGMSDADMTFLTSFPKQHLQSNSA